MRISDQEAMRLRILKILRMAQPVSRTELARLAGVTGPTITDIVGNLVARNLVVEEKLVGSGRGRPRINLRINAAGGYVVAAFQNWQRVLQIEIVDLSGQSVFSQTAQLRVPNDLATFADDIAGLIEAAIAAGPVARDAICRVGIGLAAIVNFREGIIEWMATLEGAPFPFAKVVADRLQIPVTVDRDINILARAEYWSGNGPALENLTVLAFGIGLTLARYTDGQLSSGAHGISPEFGHAKIVPDGGRLCHCGARGCLLAYSSIAGIVGQTDDDHEMQSHLRFQWPSLLRQMVASVGAGNDDARQIIDRAGRYLGIALANHINLDDPERIVVLLEEPCLLDVLPEPVQAAIAENTLPALHGRAAVEIRPLEHSAYLNGAAAMALEQLFSE